MELRTEEAKIIILSGKARSGKDTSMQIIKKKYESLGKKVICLFYASYIKEYAKRISDWDGNDETKPRTLLQVLGTDIIRNTIDNKFFINRTYQPKKRQNKKEHGFMKRMSTRAGRNVIKARRAKGREKLSA